MPRPRHTKRDSNHADVKWGCEMAGLWVWDTADLGGKFLDLIVSDGLTVVFVEVKPDRKATFTTDEEFVLLELPHVSMVAYSPEDVLRRFGRM